MEVWEKIKQEIKQFPSWIYILITLSTVLLEIELNLFSYLPTLLFPLFWIIIYFLARIKLAKKKIKGI